MAFEAFLAQDEARVRPRNWRRLTTALSLGLHAAALLGAMVHSYWYVEELEPPHVAVHFLSRPSLLPPPPAPVAAAAPMTKPAVVRRAKPAAAPTALPRVAPAVAEPSPGPAEVKDPLPKPASLAQGAPAAGETGGADPGAPAAGDSAAGVAVAEAVAPPAPPPSPPASPPSEVFLPPNTGTQLRTTDINDPRYRPSLPPALNRRGMVVMGLFRICVSESGHVKKVSVMKSADPLVDETWSALIRTWEYRPYSVAGHPVGFCHAARIEVRATG